MRPFRIPHKRSARFGSRSRTGSSPRFERLQQRAERIVARTGTTTLEVLRFGGRAYRIPGEVTDLRAGHSFAWKASKAHGTRSVEPVDESTCVVALTMHVRLAGAERVFGRLLARMMRRNLAGDLGRLAEVARAHSGRAQARR